MAIPSSQTATTPEPLLFEYVGEIISGLSYVHSVVPVDILGLERQLNTYYLTLEREFDTRELEKTYREFLHKLQEKTGTNKTTQSLNFDRSVIAKWNEIGTTHLHEVALLKERVAMLKETIPPTDPDEVNTELFTISTREEDIWNKDYTMRTDNRPNWNAVGDKFNPFTRKPRQKRHPALIVAAGAAILGGTAFGIYNTIQISQLWDAVGNIEKKLLVFENTFKEFSKDIIELQDEVHGILLKQLLDAAFDTGVLVARLRVQHSMFSNRISRYFSAMQAAQFRRLAVDYLDEATVKRIFQQARQRARSANCVLLIRQPSDLFQIETSYAFTGRKISLIIHIPISPPESSLRLYRLHPFPLPYDNNTFLIPRVNEDVLAISNTNHRYTMQLSSIDMLGCTTIGRTHFCERNGLLTKYPEDTCLGALYHQKYEEARELCSFHLEPAREYVRQLRDNWFLIYSESPQTLPLVCANKSYTEIHIRGGASKFHLSAGCTADLPRHRLISDISILLPQDYVQFDMEWDPTTFLPEIRDYIIPEYQRLQRYGQSRVALSQIQANVAASLDSPKWFHNFHFSGNGVAIITSAILVLLALYKCWSARQQAARERRGRKIEDAVRTALNGIPSRGSIMMSPLPMQMPMTMPMPLAAPPALLAHPSEYIPLSRVGSYTNLTSVSDGANRTYIPNPLQIVPPPLATSTPSAPPSPHLSGAHDMDMKPPRYHDHPMDRKDLMT